MSDAAVGDLVFYRAKTSLGRALTFRVAIDGREAGTLRGSKRFTVALPPGRHIASVRAGRAGSAEVAVDVEGGRASMMVIDVAARDPGLGGDPLSALVLRPTGDPQSPAARRSALRFENETIVTRWFLVVAAACLLLGPTLRQFSNVVGFAVGALGAVALVAFGVRKLLYRAPSHDR